MAFQKVSWGVPKMPRGLLSSNGDEKEIMLLPVLVLLMILPQITLIPLLPLLLLLQLLVLT